MKSYIIKGYSINKEKLKNPNKYGKDYFDELLEIIKEIRTSERRFYQKVTDIFAECSIDYNKNSEIANNFYATIQNKFHFAITKNTAAEIIYKRVDSKKKNMGLTTWKEAPEGKILKSDVTIAKNYLSETELKNLNNVVNIFLDIAEDNAERNIPMYMNDWKKEVDTVLSIRHYDILEGKGKISKKEADEKAEKEYEKYKVIQDKRFLSDFDILLLEAENINKSKNDEV